MRNIIVAILCSILFLNALAQGSILQSGTASSVNVSPKRLQKIDQLLQEQIDSGFINGAVGLVAKDGRIICYKAFGLDDIDKKTPLRKDAIFRIASQSKAITSAAVMMLFDEGKLSLDDSIAKYIPAFANQQVIATFNAKDSTYTTVPAKRTITVRDLLTHTSGIGYAQIGTDTINAIYAKAGLKLGFVSEPERLSDAMDRLSRFPLSHHPGERFTYGLSTDVLGYLVEVVSGMSLDDFLHKRIFAPLGMKDTYFYLPTSKQNRLATAYSGHNIRSLKKWDETAAPHFDVNYPKVKGTYFSGGAGLSSTITDYANFLQMLLNGGKYNGRRILSEHAVDLMTSNQIGDMPWYGGNKFGLGFEIVTKADQAKYSPSEGSYRWAGFYSTRFWVDPKKNLIGLLFMQQFPVRWDLFEKYSQAVYQALDK